MVFRYCSDVQFVECVCVHACVRACLCVWVGMHSCVHAYTYLVYIFKAFKVSHIYTYINDLLCFAVVCGFKNYYRGQWNQLLQLHFVCILSVCFQFLLLIFFNIFDVGICFCLKNQYFFIFLNYAGVCFCLKTPNHLLLLTVFTVS